MGAVPDDIEAKMLAGVSTSNSDVKVLTVADNKRYGLPPEQQEMMCFTSDGVLWVSSSHRNSHYVFAFRERLNKNKVPHAVKVVAHSDIAKVYRKFGGSVGGGDEASLRQNEVLRVLREAVALNASDVHLRIETDATRIKMRVDGDLDPYEEIGVQHGKDLASTIYQSMCDVAQATFIPDKPQDARMKSSLTSAIGLKGARVATRPTDGGQVMVLRLLYHHDGRTTLESLGLLPEQVATFKRMAQRPEGINLVGGPTGSGKSRTLEVHLNLLLEEAEYKVNLVTVEDPPEYTIKGAVQTPLQYHSDATDDEISQAWARAIANTMRLDPDLLYIGETRDHASAMAAFRAAMTGHGIYTTVHANDIVGNMTRLRDLGVNVELLTDPALVTGLVSQRLVKKVCENCRRPYKLSRKLVADDLAERIETYCDPDRVFLNGRGCSRCRGRGTYGRMLVAEAMIPAKPFMRIFRDRGASDARAYWVKEMYGITRNQVLIQRINEGLIDPSTGERSVCALDEDAITLE